MASVSLRPFETSIGRILIASGFVSEISSILTPPSAEAINTGPWFVLSSVIEKYFSSTISNDY